MMSDKEIMSEIVAGNSDAFAEVYNRYIGEFVGFVRKHFRGSDDDIYDIYHDSCMALYSNILSRRLTAEALGEVSLKTYLFRIGHNKMVDVFRRANTAQRRSFIENFDYSEWDDECEEVLSEREQKIREVVSQMGEPCATILAMYYWQDKSMREIASEAGYSNADTAKSLKSRCMAKVKAYVAHII